MVVGLNVLDIILKILDILLKILVKITKKHRDYRSTKTFEVSL